MNRFLIVFALSLSLVFFKFNVYAEADRFKKALPGYDYAFPRDHGSHPDYLIEWWYFTGNLSSEEGKAYGYELTFFRRGIENKHADQNPSKWTVRDIYLAHFAVTDIDGEVFYFDEKISREALGKAGAKEEHLQVWIDRWSVRKVGDTIRLSAGDEEWNLDLSLKPLKPLIIQGEAGISKKGEAYGAASHYYSFTRLQTEGRLAVNGKETAVSGLSWMDHEFGSALLGEGQSGWDWFSIQLDDGSEYMFYQIREKDGKKAPVSSGTVVFPDGTKRHLTADDFTLTPQGFWKSQKSGANYPLEWTLSVPSEQLVLKSKPALKDQELVTEKSTRVTYWEGASDFTGEKGGKRISGKGYIELTGYAGGLGSE